MKAIIMTPELSALINLRKQLQATFDNLKTLQYDNNHALQLGDTLDALESEIDRIDYIKVLSISFDTGTYNNKVVHFIGDSNSDIMALIDEYASYENCELAFYEATEVLSYDADYIDETFLPINGGACYTDMALSSNETDVYSIMAILDAN